jgi:hypothetical protein
MEWTLEIGGIAVTVEGPEEWVGVFARFWERWTGRAAGWVVHLERDPSLPEPESPLFSARPTFHDGLCTLKARGFMGEIVPSRGQAVLKAHPAASPGDVDCFVRTVFALRAFEQGALLFHAAGVVHRDSAWAFFGPSGSGKTTVTSFSQGKEVLSDDLVLLRRGRSGWEAWATPFSLYRGNRMAAPLRALVRLIKAPEDRLVPLPPAVALGELVASSPIVNADPSRLSGLFARWEEILAGVPVCALRFRKTDAFWGVIDAEFG